MNKIYRAADAFSPEAIGHAVNLMEAAWDRLAKRRNAFIKANPHVKDYYNHIPDEDPRVEDVIRKWIEEKYPGRYSKQQIDDFLTWTRHATM